VIERLRQWWRSARHRDTKPFTDDASLCSLVLLLRAPRSFSLCELREAAERGWHRKFDGVEDPMYFAVEQKPIAMIKAGPSVMQVLQASKPYLSHTPEVLKHLHQPEQKKACLDHFAWVAIDQWNRDLTKSEAYASLAKLAQQLSDENCSGLYLPGENILMPNDGTAEQGLWFLIRGELFQ
jgi:hypothetical protein